jgi:hypothetical protein
MKGSQRLAAFSLKIDKRPVYAIASFWFDDHGLKSNG